jgi:hypothetical protein
MAPRCAPELRNAFIARSSSQAVIVQKTFFASRNTLPPIKPEARRVWRTDWNVRQTNWGRYPRDRTRKRVTEINVILSLHPLGIIHIISVTPRAGQRLCRVPGAAQAPSNLTFSCANQKPTPGRRPSRRGNTRSCSRKSSLRTTRAAFRSWKTIPFILNLILCGLIIAHLDSAPKAP